MANSDATRNWSEEFSKCGLHVLVPGTQPIADIVAVHGLAAHPWYTWTKTAPFTSTEHMQSEGDGKVMWLRDLLPNVIPNARVLMYSHDSKYLWNASKESLRSIAAGLIRRLDALRAKEKETMNRPIIFIGHSFGGIVVEEALLYANHRDNYRCLAVCTIGVVFLGTPHRGSKVASWGKLIASCAALAALGSETRLLKTLEEGSERLELVIDDFTVMARQMRMALVCFFELLETEFRKIPLVSGWAKTMVVEKSSATIDDYESIPLQLDHSNLNKFGSAEEDSFRSISSKLKELVDGCYAFGELAVVSEKKPSTTQTVEITPGARLPISGDALFNSAHWQHDSFCLPGTRVDLLNEIDSWSINPESPTIYWLSGMAGTGKSTIARSMARNWHMRQQLAASFMFSRGHDDLSQARKFVTTIAYQLWQTVPEQIRQLIVKAINSNPDIISRSLHDQWSLLVLQPLSDDRLWIGNSLAKPFLLVIDALDECDNEEDLQLIIHLLETLKPVRFRVFITSRPEVPILSGFKDIPEGTHHDFVLHDIDEKIVQHDIRNFLRHELGKIQVNRKLPSTWPGCASMETLVQKAGTLFIYASTICRFIGERKFDPRKRLSLILGTDTLGRQNFATGSLDAMYTKVLEQSVLEGCDSYEIKELAGKFRDIIGPIVVLFDSLSAYEAAGLLGPSLDHWDVEDMLDQLGSVIDASEDRKIRLLHPSFRDFLLDSSRCKNGNFQINRQSTHNTILLKCLQLISTHLRKDICNLQHPGVLRSKMDNNSIKECLPQYVQYACQHWVSHLQEAVKAPSLSGYTFTFSNDIISEVLKFFRKNFLYWLEALSLSNRMPEGCSALIALEDTILKAKPEVDGELLSTVYDAKRFILRNSVTIQEAPLQVYCAALLFSPMKSKVREYFWSEIPVWLKYRPGPVVQEYWNSLVTTCKFDGTATSVWALAFSPDGKLLAAACREKLVGSAVLLWDAKTGAHQKTIKSRSLGVYRVVFSPEGNLLASASGAVIEVWDPKTGERKMAMEDHTCSVLEVAFSPDGNLIASASNDEIVKIWDLKTGECKMTLRDHTCTVWAAAFSPDVSLLISVSRSLLQDKAFRIRDLKTGQYKTAIGHTNDVTAVAFSPDGNLIASGSRDETIKIWDPKTGECKITLRGHAAPVIKVAFSLDASLLASASVNNTIRIWDLKTDQCKTVINHPDLLNTIAFSPDGKFLASASVDCTVRIWNTYMEGSNYTSVANLRPKQIKPPTSLTSLLLSQNKNSRRGSQLGASASNGKTATISDPKSRECQSTVLESAEGSATITWDSKTVGTLKLFGNTKQVNKVTFSPDGNYLASASTDMTVRIWDLTTGECKISISYTNLFNPVTFSPDGNLIASTSDETIKIWNLKTGECIITMRGHTNFVVVLAFSPNRDLLASGSTDMTVRIWDPKTGECKISISHTDSINSIAFSPDGNLIASASKDYKIRIWDPKTGEYKRTLISYTSWTNRVTFSPNGNLLASAAYDVVRIWDYSTGDFREIFFLESITYVGDYHFRISGDTFVRCSISLKGMWIHLDFMTASEIMHSINIKDGWIRWGNELESLLPLAIGGDDVPTCWDSRNNILAVGYDSGQVKIFEFDVEGKPPWNI